MGEEIPCCLHWAGGLPYHVPHSISLTQKKDKGKTREASAKNSRVSDVSLIKCKVKLNKIRAHIRQSQAEPRPVSNRAHSWEAFLPREKKTCSTKKLKIIFFPLYIPSGHQGPTKKKEKKRGQAFRGGCFKKHNLCFLKHPAFMVEKCETKLSQTYQTLLHIFNSWFTWDN